MRPDTDQKLRLAKAEQVATLTKDEANKVNGFQYKSVIGALLYLALALDQISCLS